MRLLRVPLRVLYEFLREFLCNFFFRFLFEALEVIVVSLKILVYVSDTLKVMRVLGEFPSPSSPSRYPRGSAVLRRVPQVPTYVSNFLEALRVLAEFVKILIFVTNFFGTSVLFLIIYKLLDTSAGSIRSLLVGTQYAPSDRETIF